MYVSRMNRILVCTLLFVPFAATIACGILGIWLGVLATTEGTPAGLTFTAGGFAMIVGSLLIARHAFTWKSQAPKRCSA